MSAPVFYWHIHHEVLCEPLTEPIENRIAWIKANKAEAEIATRLRLMQPVKGQLPAAYQQAWAAYKQARVASQQAVAAYEQAWTASQQAWTASQQAWTAYKQAWTAYDQARAASQQAWAKCQPEIEALHKLECPDCPWDGRTIFREDQ